LPLQPSGPQHLSPQLQPFSPQPFSPQPPAQQPGFPQPQPPSPQPSSPQLLVQLPLPSLFAAAFSVAAAAAAASGAFAAAPSWRAARSAVVDATPTAGRRSEVRATPSSASTVPIEHNSQAAAAGCGRHRTVLILHHLIGRKRHSEKRHSESDKSATVHYRRAGGVKKLNGLMLVRYRTFTSVPLSFQFSCDHTPNGVTSHSPWTW